MHVYVCKNITNFIKKKGRYSRSEKQKKTQPKGVYYQYKHDYMCYRSK